VVDIRGKGLIVGVEFANPEGSAAPNGGGMSTPMKISSRVAKKRVAKKCIEKGMVILTTSAFEVIRFIPPLNMSKQDLEKGCTIFVDAVNEVVKEG
jgi:4-aminobutyrate aminotransferase